DVEAVGVGVGPLVAAGGDGEQQDLRVPGDHRVVQLDLPRRPPTLGPRRRLVAQQLFHGLGKERRVRGQSLALVWVVGEDDGRPPQQPADGLGAGDEQEHGELDRLLFGHAPDDAAVVDDLRLHEGGEQVVARVATTLRQLTADVVGDLDTGVDGRVVDDPDVRFDVED